MSLSIDSMDLDIQEKKIFSALFALGPLSFGEILEYTKFTPEDVRKTINSLKNGNYIYEIEGIASRYQAIVPFTNLKISAESIIEELESLGVQLDQHISEKLGLMLNKLREESQKIGSDLKKTQEEVKQSEIKSEGDTESKIAKYALEIEQGTSNSKNEIKMIFEDGKKEHQVLTASNKEIHEQNAVKMIEQLQSLNEELQSKYKQGIDELKGNESQRIEDLKNQISSIVTQTQTSLNEGIQNVQKSMNGTGLILFNSLDVSNDKLTSTTSNFTSEFIEKTTQVSDRTKVDISNSLKSFSENFSQKLDSNRKEALSTLQTTRDGIKSKSSATTQNLHQSITEIIISTQNQLNQMLIEAQKTLSEQINEIKSTLEKIIGDYSESINVQLDNDIEKAVSSTETTFSGFSEEVQSLSKTANNNVDISISSFAEESKNKANELEMANKNELTQIIDSIKKEINSNLEQFNTILSPQINFLKESLIKLESDFELSQTKAKSEFEKTLDKFMNNIEVKGKILSEQITQESINLTENIKTFTDKLSSQLNEYDSKYNETLIKAIDRESERLVAQTLGLKEKVMFVVTDMAKVAIDQLNTSNQIISASIQSQIVSLESGLSDYSLKFKEITQKNDQLIKNYVSSIEQLSNLVKQTPPREVQTALIFSKEATLAYIHEMFERMKGGMTLLIPNVNDIPLELILSTKNHQRITLVTNIDPSKHEDLLKKLFQKPNVRVRSVDTSRFEGVERNIAADRDAEEVIIGIVEDKGETVAIASQADAFINLIGKLVIGGTFLAQSLEITRASVGM